MFYRFNPLVLKDLHAREILPKRNFNAVCLLADFAGFSRIDGRAAAIERAAVGANPFENIAASEKTLISTRRPIPRPVRDATGTR